MRIEELETPTVVVDLDAMEQNIRGMAEYGAAHGIALRPHTKTHKTPEIARLQVAAGSQGVTVAKSGEAEVMAAAGMDDLLLAYPVYGTAKWERVARLARETRFTVALDSEVPAEGLAAAARASGSTVGVLIEFDVGARRCGIGSPAEVLALARRIAPWKGLELRGVMFYPGHVWDPPDRQAPALAKVSENVQEVVSALRDAGFDCPVVSGGSTPTARNSHLVAGLTEIRAGTYVFNDRNTLGVGACRTQDCALRVLATIVSTAVAGRAIADSGSKTLAADRWLSGDGTGYGLVVGHPEVQVAGLSEEHGHLDVSSSEWRPKVGERIEIIPNHVCACVNLHDQLIFHRDGVVEGCWRVAGRGLIR